MSSAPKSDGWWPIPLTAGEVHLWLVYPTDIWDAALLKKYRSLLDVGERCQETRYRFSVDRHRYLLTRALVRLVLSRYAPVEPHQWRFAPSPYGRPIIENSIHKDFRVEFNVSHSDGIIVLAISREAIGVDVENVHRRDAPVDVAGTYFSPTEVRELLLVEKSHRSRRFFEYWTFKESYIKARGQGLSIPLDQFGFSFPDERSVTFSVSRELHDDARRWQFWQLSPRPEFLIAVCRERHQKARLVIRNTVPSVYEETVLVESTRCSV